MRYLGRFNYVSEFYGLVDTITVGHFPFLVLLSFLLLVGRLLLFL
jgi:hypothetical protein